MSSRLFPLLFVPTLFLVPAVRSADRPDAAPAIPAGVRRADRAIENATSSSEALASPVNAASDLAAAPNGLLAGATPPREPLLPAQAPPAPPAAKPKSTQAVLLRMVEAEYTPEARAAGLQGSVILYLNVNPAGVVDQAEVIQRLGMGLDEKAVAAAKQWRFVPATKDGFRVSEARSAEIIFRLSPTASWEIRRMGFVETQQVPEHLKRLSMPELEQYVSPGPGACASSGGVAIVDFRVTKKGIPDHLRIVEEHGTGVGTAAVNAIRSWRFQSALMEEVPIAVSGTAEMQCRSTGNIATSPLADPSPVVRSGEGGNAMPEVVYKREPVYSVEAYKAKYQGIVRLRIVVDATGHAVNMSVVQPLGLGLDERAMGAVSQWRFKPGIKDGKPVGVLAYVEVKFELR
jgi:TonB family protein